MERFGKLGTGIELRNSILSETALNNYIDETALYLQQAQARHFERWGNLGISTGTPEIDPDPNTFEGQLIKFKNWISTRISWLDANMPGDVSTCSLALQANNTQTIQLYPNPAHTTFQVLLPNDMVSSKGEISIIDMLGRTIYQSTVTNWNLPLDITSYETGTYLVQITVSDKKLTSKLVIK